MSEIFGPTIQGEGPSAGRAAAFLRLGMCNLQCSWCDTKYTWDAQQFDLAAELKLMNHLQVAELLNEIDAPLLVITGGEPGLQAAGCLSAISALPRRRDIEIETSGTVPLGPLAKTVSRVVVSPKLANSGVMATARLRWPVLGQLADLDHAVFKFVVRDEGELDEVARIVEVLELSEDRVWIMPEGTEAHVLLECLDLLGEPVSRRGWNLTSRLHIMYWGDVRGR